MLPEPLANAIIVLVTIMLAVNFGAVFFVTGYEPDPLIYTIFMGIVGGAYATRGKKPPPGDDGEKP